MVLIVKNSPANAGDIRDVSLILWLVRSLGGGHGNPLQYFCLENILDRGAWQAMVYRVSKSWTRLKWLSTQHTHRKRPTEKEVRRKWIIPKDFVSSEMVTGSLSFLEPQSEHKEWISLYSDLCPRKQPHPTSGEGNSYRSLIVEGWSSVVVGTHQKNMPHIQAQSSPLCKKMVGQAQSLLKSVLIPIRESRRHSVWRKFCWRRLH